MVGVDSLSAPDRLILEVSRSIREDFLHQNSFHDVDTFTSLLKQYRLLELILHFYHKAGKAIEQGVSIHKLIQVPVLERIGRAKYIRERNVTKEYDEILSDIDSQIDELIKEGAEEL